MMLFASCQQENLEPAAQESTVTFSVELPGVQTKTIGDGFNVDQLVYEVWKTEGKTERDLKDTKKATRLYQEKATMATIDGEQKTVISLNLVHDQNYTILFWAQNSKGIGNEPAYNTTDLTAVTYAKNVTDGTYFSNNENMAAFYGSAFIEAEEVEIPSTRRVELRRPFAQLNIGTKNTATEYTVTMDKSKVKISNVPTVFDVAQNISADSENGITGQSAVSEPMAFVFESADLPTNPSELKVNGIEYDYVAMNYIFANGNVEVEYWIDATLTAANPTEGRNETTNAVVYNRVPQVPLMENYRTNIVGNLLTSTTQYEVVIDASWEDVYEENWDGNVEEVWDENYIQEPPMVNGVYQISLASELAWVAAKVNGMPYIDPVTNSVKYADPVSFSGVEFVLVEDIDLVGEDGDELVWTPIGTAKEFQGSFDGQGHTISNLVVRSEGTTPAGLFGKVKSGTVKNVTVLNADVQGHGSAAVIVAHGVCAKIDNCHVEEAYVLSTPFNKDEANNVGGIVGYLSGETVGYVTNSSVKNATITGYRKVGGVAGAANQTAEVSGNTLENVTVIADQTYEYNGDKPVDLGKFAGYKHEKATVENNTEVTDNNGRTTVELIHKVNSIEKLSNAAKGAIVKPASGEYNLTSDVTLDQSSIQINEGNVIINGHDYNIAAGSTGNYAFIAKGANSSLVLDATVSSYGGGISADNNAKVVFNGQGVDISKYTTSSPGRYNIYARAGGEIVINSGTFKFHSTNNTRRAYVCVENGGKVIITGGTFGFDPSEWVAAGYHAKKDGSNWVVVSLSEGDNLKDAVAVAGATVKIAAGEYTFPQTIAEGVKIVCEPGTVFTGSPNLNLKTASVEGATFKNENGSVVNSGSISGTYKSCVFEGQNAFRYGYAGETLVFEDCTFRETGSEWVFHFDGASTGVTNASIICRRCTFDGDRVAIAGGVNSLVMEDCNFINGSYFNSYCNSEYSGCNFNTSVRPLAAHHKYTDCTINGAPVALSNLKFYNGYDCTLEIDGVAYTFEDGFVTNAEGAVVVWTCDLLQNALNSASADMTIALYNDIAGDVVVPQKEDVKIVINGNGKNYAGMITVDGKSEAYATAGLTVKDLIFNATAIAGDACIRLGDGTTATRYTSNVTVENCTFDVPGAVGVKSYTGGDKNIKLTGCTATANAHSLLQAAGIHGVLVEECTINSKNGLNFNNSVDVVIDKCNADVRGYAARFGEGSAATGAAEAYAITNSTLKSACEDGDAVIILRGSADLATLTIENTTLEGTTLITNNANGAKVIINGVEQ